MASKGEMWVFDLSCITQLQSEITTDSIAHNCITWFSGLLTCLGRPIFILVPHPPAGNTATTSKHASLIRDRFSQAAIFVLSRTQTTLRLRGLFKGRMQLHFFI